MRNLRVVNWSLRVIAVKVVAVAALSPISMGQSFDYPANSPTIFNRNSSQSAPTVSELPNDGSQRPSLFSKLFNRKPVQPGSSFAAAPVFNGAPANQTRSNTFNQGAEHTVYIDPYAVNAHQGQRNPTGVRSNGRMGGGSLISRGVSGGVGNVDRVARVNFDQQNPSPQQSVLDRQSDFNAPLKRPAKAPESRVAKRPASLAKPSAKPVQRVSLPRDAFKNEFEKAYQFINQPKTAAESETPLVAQVRDVQVPGTRSFAPGPLTADDLDLPNRRSLEGEFTDGEFTQGDFSDLQQPEIETPDFIQPLPSEQSPNAIEPDFTPPRRNNRFDLIPESTVAKPSTRAPWMEPEEPTVDDAVKQDPVGGDSDMGNIDDWQPPQAQAIGRTPKVKSDDRTLENDFEELSKPFVPKATNSAESPLALSQSESPIWWKQLVNQPLHPENQTLPIDSNGLVFSALQNSPRIQAVSKNPLIRELQVVEADAEFDPIRFVRSQFQDRVDPVGNSLTIGQGSSVQFLRDNIWTGEAGIRRKLRTGADLTVSQQLGFQNSNSNNFTPQDQGTATLALNVTQPLLRGRGQFFNQAQILIAQSTGGVAWEVFQQELQEELEGVVSAYWQLYLDRSIYLQRKRNVDRGQLILDRLQGRRELDSLPAQIARAKSSVQTRKTELANAFRNVRDAETEIRRRIADRNWMAAQTLELLPAELPTVQDVGWELDQVVKTALNHRPEIRESMRRIKIAGVQRDVSENELLPELSFLFGTYVSALQGESDVLGAFADQFGEVTPGYSFGLEYELPRFNRAARSRFQQRHLQFRRLQNELEEVIQNVIAESQIAVRRISSAIETLEAAEEAIVAARADLSQNERRWESFALVEGDIAEGVTPTTILDQLLDSQERLSQAEIVFAQSERELKVAEVALQRSMGTLLMQQRVSYDRVVSGDTPVVNLRKQRADGPAPIDGGTFVEHPQEIESQGLSSQPLQHQNSWPQDSRSQNFQPENFQSQDLRSPQLTPPAFRRQDFRPPGFQTNFDRPAM